MPQKKANIDTDRALRSALVHHQAGRLAEARNIYQNILRLTPDHPDALHLLGMVLHQEGKTGNAIKLIKRAIKLNPSSPIFYNNLGELYRLGKNHEKAHACYRKALQLKPDFAEPYKNTGNLYKETGDFKSAVNYYKKALTLRPDHVDTCYSLGNALQEQGIQKEALHYYHRAFSLRPEHIPSRWAYAMSQIPLMHTQELPLAESRSNFSREIIALEEWLASHKTESAYETVGNQHPFYLAYQPENNRDLLAHCGKLYSHLMQGWQEKHHLQMHPHEPGDRVRIGIVSAHIRNHSVWNAIVRGWVKKLDRKQFEIHLFHTGSKRDLETDWAQAHSDSFTEQVPRLNGWTESILKKQPDILIYPEIGMDQTTTKLASMRLAPVQMAAWGHPETTGLPTMDYYLSAENFEPDNARTFYTEQLIPLPHLGCYYEPEEIRAKEPDLAKLHIHSDLPIMICPGAPFKYSPAYDHVFTKIAHKLGECQFVFFTHPVGDLSTRLANRLKLAFNNTDMDFKRHVIFIPWQDKARFHGLMQHADVFLDTIGFSGFNTVMQAIECGLPPVTVKGEFMRGRLASGILQQMNIEDLIATTPDEYVDIATRLVQDNAYNQSIRATIKARRQTLGCDSTPIQALEEILQASTKRKAQE